jgi:hypothetical protein
MPGESLGLISAGVVIRISPPSRYLPIGNCVGDERTAAESCSGRGSFLKEVAGVAGRAIELQAVFEYFEPEDSAALAEKCREMELRPLARPAHEST